MDPTGAPPMSPTSILKGSKLSLSSFSVRDRENSPSFSGSSLPKTNLTVKEHEEENRRLDKLNFNLKLRIFHLEEQLRKLQQEVGDDPVAIMEQRDKLREELDDRNNLLIKARNAIETLKADLELVRAEAAEKQRDSIGRIRQEEHQRALSNLEDRSRAVAAMEEKLQAVPVLEEKAKNADFLQRRVGDMDSELSALRAENERLRGDLKRSETDRDRLKTACSEMELELRNKGDDAHNLRLELGKANERLEVALRTGGENEGELRTVRYELATIKSTLDDVKSQKEAVVEKKRAAKAEAQRLREEKLLLENTNKTLEDELNEMKSEVQNGDRERQMLKETVQYLERKVDEAEGVIENKETKWRRSVQEVEGKVEEKTLEVRELEDRWKSRVAEIQRKLEEENRRNSELKELLQQEQSTIKGLKATMDQYASDGAAASEKLADSEKSIADAENRCVELEKEYAMKQQRMKHELEQRDTLIEDVFLRLGSTLGTTTPSLINPGRLEVPATHALISKAVTSQLNSLASLKSDVQMAVEAALQKCKLDHEKMARLLAQKHHQLEQVHTKIAHLGDIYRITQKGSSQEHRDQLRHTTDALHAVQSEHARLQSEHHEAVQGLHGEIARWRQSYADLEERSTCLVDEVLVLKGEVDAARKEAMELRAQLQVQSQNSKLEYALNDANRKIDRLSENNRLLILELEEKSGLLDKLKRQVKASHEEKVRLNNEIAGVRRVNQELESKWRQLLAQKESFDVSKTALEEDMMRQVQETQNMMRRKNAELESQMKHFVDTFTSGLPGALPPSPEAVGRSGDVSDHLFQTRKKTMEFRQYLNEVQREKTIKLEELGTRTEDIVKQATAVYHQLVRGAEDGSDNSSESIRAIQELTAKNVQISRELRDIQLQLGEVTEKSREWVKKIEQEHSERVKSIQDKFTQKLKKQEVIHSELVDTLSKMKSDIEVSSHRINTVQTPQKLPSITEALAGMSTGK